MRDQPIKLLRVKVETVYEVMVDTRNMAQASRDDESIGRQFIHNLYTPHVMPHIELSQNVSIIK